MLVYPYQQPFRGLQINKTHPLARKLIGYWPFNDGTGKKVWDYSGNANRGTLEGGATWAPGRRGWAVNCDGVDGRVDCGNKAPLDDLGNGSFWLSFRMKSKDAVPLIYGMLFAKGPDVANMFFLCSFGTANRLNFYFRKGDVGIPNTQFSTATMPFDTIWNHIVLEINRTTDKAVVYMNTVKDATEIDISTVPVDGSNIGNIEWGVRLNGLFPYEGLLGNCLLGKGILSQEEINWLYREPYAMFVPWRRRYYSIPKTIKRAYIRFQPAGAEIVVQATGAIILFE